MAVSNLAGGLGGLAQGLGGLVGMKFGQDDMGQAQQQALAAGQGGVSALQGAQKFAQGAFDPYQQAGTAALGNQAQAVGALGGMQPQKSGAFNFNATVDPSAQYSADQSNRALQASAIAHGAAGGGLATALQRNQNNLSQQAYGNAYDRYLKQNAQDFGQGQQQFANAGQIAGMYGDMANRGFSAANANAGMQMQGASGINQNAMGQMSGIYEQGAANAKNDQAGASNIAAGLGTALSFFL